MIPKEVGRLQKRVQGGERTGRWMDWSKRGDRELLELSAFLASIKHDPQKMVGKRWEGAHV